MPEIKVAVNIKKPPEAVYKAIKDMESFPAFMRYVKSLKILKRLGQNRMITAWEIEVDEAPVNWKEEDFFDDANLQVKFNMTEGNYKQYYGAWLIEKEKNGSRLVLSATFDWGIPVLDKHVTNALEKRAQHSLLGMARAIKNKVEKANV